MSERVRVTGSYANHSIDFAHMRLTSEAAVSAVLRGNIP